MAPYCTTVFKYEPEGSGVHKDGGEGSAGKSAGVICGLLAQAMRDSAKLVKTKAQRRFAKPNPERLIGASQACKLSNFYIG